MAWDVVETLCGLVRIPSVNPMGREATGDEFFEHALTSHLVQLFEQLGVPWLRQEVEPRRANVLAKIEGEPAADKGGQLIVFQAHQDTVPVDGMTIPPWTPEVRDGRVYGRGACDVKGGMACMLSALSRLAEERPRGRPTVVVAFSVNEEHGFTGARALARWWASGGCALVPRVPNAVIVAEPTQLNVVVAHKGLVRWRYRARGRAAHSSMPERGQNAIYHMARVVLALEAYARDVIPTLGRHPLLDAPSLSVGVIRGGLSVNTVPDDCSIEIDRRLLPHEDSDAAIAAVTDWVRASCPGVDILQEKPFLAGPGLADERNAAIARRLGRIVQSCGGPGALVAVPYGTDAPSFDQIGAPTVVFGPGSVEQAHTSDEWIAINELQTATEVFYQIGTQGLGHATG